MSMAKPLSELRAMLDDELIAAHDELARNAVIGLNYYGEELLRREQHKQTQEVIRLTDQIKKLTMVIVVLTVVIGIATIATFFV